MIIPIRGAVNSVLQNSQNTLPPVSWLLLAIIGGAIGGVIFYSILGWLYGWSGRRMGGQATNDEVRCALAWGSVPVIASLPITVLAMLILALMNDAAGVSDVATISAAFTAFGLAIVLMILSVWAFIVELKCLGEAHGFSAWRAFGAQLLAGLVVMGVMLAIALVVGILVAIF